MNQTSVPEKTRLPERTRCQKRRISQKCQKKRAPVCDALRTQHFGKLTEEDISVFEQVMEEVFPGNQLLKENNEEFKRLATEIIQSLELKATEKFLARLALAFKIMRNRHGLLILGPTRTGKSTFLEVLQKTLSKLNDGDQIQDGEPVLAVDSETICIDNLGLDDLYGSFDSTTKKWSDGKITKVFRKFASAADNRQKWIIFSGQIHPIWVERLNSVLDDNKKLCLENGEIIQASRNMRFIFETNDCNKATPAFISRSGVILLSEKF